MKDDSKKALTVTAGRDVTVLRAGKVTTMFVSLPRLAKIQTSLRRTLGDNPVPQ